MLRIVQIIRSTQRPLWSVGLAVLLLCDFALAITLTGSARSVLLPGESTHFLRLERRSMYLVRKGQAIQPPPAFPLWSTLAIAQKDASPQDILELTIGQKRRINVWVPVLDYLELSYRWCDGAAVDAETQRLAAGLMVASLHSDAAQIVEFKAKRVLDTETFIVNEWDFEALAEAIESHAMGNRKILWSGVIQAGIALILATCFVQSLAWLPRWVRAVRRQQWQCRGCGYDLRGSDGAKCPECGGPTA